MGLGNRKRETQGMLWVSTDKPGSGPRNVLYDRLNGLLAEVDFYGRFEAAAAPYYETTGRKSLAPGVYFRTLFIGCFEGIDSQRGTPDAATTAARWPASWVSAPARRRRTIPRSR